MNDWTAAYVRCPDCLQRSTWCAPDALEYICVACNGMFLRKGQSFTGYTPYRQLSEWDRARVQELRKHAGVGGNSAVGAFG